MPRIQAIISSAFLSLALLAVSPADLSAQVFGDSSSSKAEAAILSAGSRAAAISRLKSVRSVGVVNLSFRNVPRFRTNAPDVSEFKVSAGKNISGIKRLRNALAANPVTRRALASRGISIGRVVGVDVYSSGSIRLYVL
jgi:hypothetical protein